MNQEFLELVKQYHVDIHEDKFRDSLIVQQQEYGHITWKKDTPIEKRNLKNAHKHECTKFCSSMECIYTSYEYGFGHFNYSGIRLVAKEGETKVYFDLKGEFRHNKQMDELILRINDEQNYPLPLAYYDITEQIGKGKWYHVWGFELSLEQLKTLCDANHVCDSWESNLVWQSNAQLICSLAFVTDQYYNDLIDFLNYEKEYWDEEDRIDAENAAKRKAEEEKKRKEEEKKRKEEERKEEEEKRKSEIEESKKKKAKIWKRVMIIGVLLFIGGIHGCIEDGGSWLWMSLVGAIATVASIIGNKICD